MQDEETARATLKIALIDLEYVIADLNNCAKSIDRDGNNKVHVALTQLEAAKRDLIGLIFGVPGARTPLVH